MVEQVGPENRYKRFLTAPIAAFKRSCATVDDRNPASPSRCICVLYYQISSGVGIQGLHKVMHAAPTPPMYLYLGPYGLCLMVLVVC